MDNNYNVAEKPEKQENIVLGIIGALLFSLAGGALWFGLYLVGFVAGISGIIGAICAIKGYSLFGGKESIKGIVISVVIAILIIILAWYLCVGYDIYGAYQQWFEDGDIDFTLTYAESLDSIPYFFEDPEISSAYIGDLAFGLLFCIAGGGAYAYSKIKGIRFRRNNPQSAPAAPTSPTAPSDPTDE